jgi:polyvinyl alcohol dehydrogenase (cytochrome)
MFVPCRAGGIQELDLNDDTVGPRLAGANSAPILVGDDLWAARYPTGTLTEHDATTGATVQTLQTGPVPNFASPSAALGLVMIGTDRGVTAFTGPDRGQTWPSRSVAGVNSPTGSSTGTVLPGGARGQAQAGS